MTKQMSAPHGGTLVHRALTSTARENILAQVDEFPTIAVHNTLVRDIQNIVEGVFSPLEGFMGHDDFFNVLHHDRLANGAPWTIPIVFDVPPQIRSKLGEGTDVILTDTQNVPIAILHDAEFFHYDKEEYASQVFQTTDLMHPGVAQTFMMGQFLMGGTIDLIIEPLNRYGDFRLSPTHTRELFRRRNWRTIAGFQTRNVPHLGHEYIQKTALTFVDGLFINPILGRKKQGDFKDEVILATYQTLINNYFPPERVVLGILQTYMRYAGPKEAIFHAIIRKNFGCTHFIVGRDHAGVGDFYPPYAAHEIFEEFPDLDITPLNFPSIFFCDVCKTITSDKACPHSRKCRQEFSGTKIREAIENGDQRNPSLRPEVAEALANWRKPFT
jgi:sulfate adenylyltransferase